MKTTNYEISKKLKEIGFDGKSEHRFIETKYGVFPVFGDYKSDVPHCFYKSYDLATILEALPTRIELKSPRFYNQIFSYTLFLNFFHKELYYENCGERMLRIKKEDESLADTAARLLLKLHAEGLVNFKSEEICK
jgi:hypothetical protein